MTRRGHARPGFTVCNLIDDLSFTAYTARRLANDLLNERSRAGLKPPDPDHFPISEKPETHNP
jgi:hypothetical protein